MIAPADDFDALARRLRPHYGAFLREGHVLLTGHSHQAWPDVARGAMTEAFDDAARFVDDKWARAFAKAERVRSGVATRLGVTPDEIALAGSTHELVARFLSALDLRARPRIVTSSGEFHSARRQLTRLAEVGVELHVVDAQPAATLAERVAAAVDDRTAAVILSTVLFETATVVPNASHVAAAAWRHGAEVLFDAYHAFNVVPFTARDLGDGPVFVVAGGYKYAAWGEGTCFLRVPPETRLRPVYTGWFADFASLGAPRAEGAPVGYGPRPADWFAGSTYDPVSHYRAAAVLDFFDAQGLTVERLRAVSLAQTDHLLRGLGAFDVVTPAAPEARAGFVSVRVEGAADVVTKLREAGVWTDARGSLVRLGPAPYVTREELDRALAAFRRAAAG